MKSVSIAQITARDPSVVRLKQSSTPGLDVQLTEVLPADLAGPSTLVFAADHALVQTALNRGTRALILTEALYEKVQSGLPAHITVWTVPGIPQGMSLVLPLFDRVAAFTAAGRHPTASIHPLAQVADTAHIGAYAVVEAHAQVGDHTVIAPHAYVGPYCEVGARCRIAPHVTIGADGFGFYTDKNFVHHRIPQIGKVVIEDDCEFGAHCCVDRATLTETRIRKGSKFDNFCHIAHNVQIGENALAAAGFMVAGSTVIGKNLMTAGGVHVTGHIRIADSVILSGRAGVTSGIEKPGMYGGFPLESHRESIKTLISLPQVKKLRKQVNRILDHLNLNTED